MHIIYARKSSESEERQALSISAQVDELRELASRRNIQVERVLEESYSAKKPGRPIWGRIMKDVRAGRLQGILCWKLDRLARNPVDGGAVMWELGTGKLAEIVTPGRTFTGTSDDKLLMSIEFGMATKYVDDLSENVKRGNRKKLEAGWAPGRVPIGYLNDPITRTIVKDPERFDLVRKMWDLLLSREAGPRAIQRIADGDWGLRTRITKRRGGRPLSRSAVYAIFHNPFYAGLIMRDGEIFEGAHEPMISKGEFDFAQQIVSSPSSSPKRHQFFYTGLMTCGECGASITAEFKKNRYATRYIYYHCTHGKAGVPCRQGAVQEKHLEEQLAASLEGISLPAEYEPWLLKRLEKAALGQDQDLEAMKKSLAQSITAVESKLSGLLDLRLQGLITDDEYTSGKEKLIIEKVNKEARLKKLVAGKVDAIEPVRYALSRLVELSTVYFESTRFDRRQILRFLVSHLTLRDKTLLIQYKKPFSLIGKRPSCPEWWARRDSNP